MEVKKLREHAPIYWPSNRKPFLEAIEKTYGIKFCTYSGALNHIYNREDLFVEGFYPNENDIVADIGAAIGEYTLFAAKKSKKVYAFEPNIQAYSKLIKNIEINNITNIEPHMIALGDFDGEATMRIVPNSPLMGTLDKDFQKIAHIPVRGTPSKTRNVEVPVRTLDGFFLNPNSKSLFNMKIVELPTFFNIDVEGFELNVLKGMTNILKTNNCRLIIEMHKEDQIPEIESFLKEYGYVCAVKKLCVKNCRNTGKDAYYGFFRKDLYT